MKTSNTKIAAVSNIDLTTVNGGWGHHHHGGWGFSASVGYGYAAQPVAYAAPAVRFHVGFRR